MAKELNRARIIVSKQIRAALNEHRMKLYNDTGHFPTWNELMLHVMRFLRDKDPLAPPLPSLPRRGRPKQLIKRDMRVDGRVVDIELPT